ncbi:glycosyltransferase family 4 protein [Acetobacter estunensis]|nr:glycosyltransferase family 4 protein [Acetobacter estunensis]MBV1836588.1 glycosyltransferase family 4 protein [Acetobacter estunensis]
MSEKGARVNIVHVVRQFSPSVGGLEDSVLNLALEQRRQFGLNARVVTLNRVFNREGILPPRDAVEGIPVTRLPWRGSTRYPLAPSVLWHCRDADLIHVHAIDFFFDYLAWTKPLHRKPLIVSTHGGFFHSGAYSELKKIWFSTITRASIRAYAKVVACSENDAKLFADVAHGKLVTIENGINQDKFLDASSPHPCRTLISFGRFSPHKRLDLLFPLLAALRKCNPEWRLIIAGRPAEISVAELQKQAHHFGMESAVTFLVEPSDGQLRDAMSQASWFASLSEHEGFGLAAVEGMSAGLVPVLSTIPPFRRLVTQTGVGLLSEGGDLAQTASRMEALQEAGLTGLRTQAAQGSRIYDWKDVAGRYAQVYDEVLHDRERAIP